jgi:hypothetical protein
MSADGGYEKLGDYPPQDQGVICDVNSHVEATNDVIQKVARSVDDSVKASGTRQFLFVFMQALTRFSVITLPYCIYAASVNRE